MSEPKFGAGRAAGLGVFSDQETDWAWKRALAYTTEGGASLGECLAAARRIDERDGESWITEWSALAELVENNAARSLADGQFVSAREGFLRASNYYRTAEYGTPPDHRRFHELSRRSGKAFQQAGALFDRPVESVSLPWEGVHLPGYFCRAAAEGSSRPTIIAAGGNDSSIEEMAFGAFAAVRRGFNFFTFDHPGHRGAVHLYPRLTKRAIYHDVYGTAIDYLGTLGGVDDRLILIGYSYGGYIATQVAIHEPRLAAVIPNSPIVDGRAALGGGFLRHLLQMLRDDPGRDIDAMIEEWVASSPVMRAVMHYSRWSWGFDTFADQLRSPLLDEHALEADLGEIRCPTLALVSADEGEELVRQAKVYIEGVSSVEKRLHTFTLELDGAHDHCQIDNLTRFQQVAYDWLAQVLQT